MMKITELKGQLKSEALKHSLCVDWQKMMDDADNKETLVQMYMRGIDFCFSNNYPSVDYIEENFKGICGKYGLYVNEKIKLSNVRKVALIGNSSGRLKYDGYEVAQIYIKDNSKAQIEAAGHAIITVDCFDNSTVKANVKDHAQVIINRYIGAEAGGRTDGTGILKIIEKAAVTYV